jgi:septum formation protein
MRPPLVLASTSRYRAELLTRLGLPFETEAPGVEETPLPGESAGQRATRLARAKAAAVARRRPGAWVIGSDQVAVRDGQVLGKPLDAARCEAQLAGSSGRQVTFLTAVALLRHGESPPREHLDTTRVVFRDLAPAELRRYVELERPFDCAGGFRCEGLGIALFERIDSSDPTALVGLPLIWLASALRQVGLDPLASPAGSER